MNASRIREDGVWDVTNPPRILQHDWSFGKLTFTNSFLLCSGKKVPCSNTRSGIGWCACALRIFAPNCMESNPSCTPNADEHYGTVDPADAFEIVAQPATGEQYVDFNAQRQLLKDGVLESGDVLRLTRWSEKKNCRLILFGTLTQDGRLANGDPAMYVDVPNMPGRIPKRFRDLFPSSGSTLLIERKAPAAASSGYVSASPGPSPNQRSSHSVSAASSSLSGQLSGVAQIVLSGSVSASRVLPPPTGVAVEQVGSYIISPADVLGTGAFGRVLRAFDTATGTYVAVKENIVGSDAAVAELRKEYEFVSRLSHPSLVQVLHFEASMLRALIFMEWMATGSIASVIEKNGKLPEVTLRRYLRSCLEGLAYLHAREFLHRDIKPANILVSASGEAKLSDFGLTKQIVWNSRGTAAPTAHCVGTPVYMSPESIHGRYSYGSDLWALACSVTEMATATAPWSHLPPAIKGVQMALLFHIGTAQPPEHHPHVPQHLSAALRQLLSRWFSIAPDDRGTAADALASEYFTTTSAQREVQTSATLRNASSNEQHNSSDQQ